MGKIRKIFAEEFKKFVRFDPEWAKKIPEGEVVQVIDYCNMGKSPIKYLSPQLHFSGRSLYGADRLCANFSDCENLVAIEGRFDGPIRKKRKVIQITQDLPVHEEPGAIGKQNLRQALESAIALGDLRGFTYLIQTHGVRKIQAESFDEFTIATLLSKTNYGYEYNQTVRSKMLRVFLQGLKDIEIPPYEKALANALGNSQREHAEVFLEFWPDDRNVDQELTTAVWRDFEDIVKTLLERGADVHYQDEQALRMAGMTANDRIIQMLLDNGADINQAIKKYEEIDPEYPNKDKDNRLYQIRAAQQLKLGQNLEI